MVVNGEYNVRSSLVWYGDVMHGGNRKIQGESYSRRWFYWIESKPIPFETDLSPQFDND